MYIYYGSSERGQTPSEVENNPPPVDEIGLAVIVGKAFSAYFKELSSV